jgi:hypothetical protein
METTTVTVRGTDADRFATALVDRTAEQANSLNKRGVRNVHRYEGDGFTQISYERGSAHENSWLMVTILVDAVDEQTRTVAVFVGGGGEGPFKLEEFTMRRFLKSDTFGEKGRFGTILRDIEQVCDSLDLELVAE